MDFEDIKEAHVFIHGLEFPVIIYVCNEQQHEWLQCLEETFVAIHYTMEELCRWCISHGMRYRIFVTDRELRNPIKKRRYRQIMHRLYELRFSDRI